MPLNKETKPNQTKQISPGLLHCLNIIWEGLLLGEGDTSYFVILGVALGRLLRLFCFLFSSKLLWEGSSENSKLLEI